MKFFIFFNNLREKLLGKELKREFARFERAADALDAAVKEMLRG